MKTKIIALYLPQFHCIPENNEFWGEGFTDWVTVKKAKPLFKGHQQPKIPLNNNYYDLSLEENVIWQAKIAKKYGVYGFGVYHYWFNNEKNLLTIPAEILRDNKFIETKYFLIWDNANWKRSWSNLSGNDWAPMADKGYNSKSGPQILIPYVFGEEDDWKNHYNYVKTHFLSDNYIKIDNKPVFSILGYHDKIEDMCDCWDRWARDDGYDGIFFVFRNIRNVSKLRYRYNYEPHTAGWINRGLLYRIKSKICQLTNIQQGLIKYNYDRIWMRLLKNARSCTDDHVFYGAFISYDDTPRRGFCRSKIVVDGNPDKFEKYFRELLEISDKKNKEFVFLTAWNEWGEGAYMEPDNNYSYSYLEAVRRCIF